ncbi:uncharacterized protein LOC131951120 [Physella acuta]|uniref:uncharacterized protein LOC131951120 n=1 Tax=Physella acuta TaxID=109671 RepID=UPI0027DB39D9|nr:uncharacterized protein LOC131951120 [Physella acuta]
MQRSTEKKEIKISSKGDDQGDHECEVWTEGTDGTSRWHTCHKNPGHHGFIKCQDFHLQHLPKSYQDQDILKLITSIAELTVRVNVNYTSFKRPKGYIFSNYGGQTTTHTGTGFVYHCGFRDRVGLSCSCHECLDNPDAEKRTRWWIVRMRTAKHVVFDDDEAKNCTIEAFYDEDDDEKSIEKCVEDTLKKKGNVLFGLKVLESNFDCDWCEVEAFTHDKELGQKLHVALEKFSALRKTLNHHRTDDHACPPLAVIVSHPHGYSKRISLGKWLERKVHDLFVGDAYNTEMTEYTYDTPTCRGSSGASVLILGRGVSLAEVFGIYGPMWYHPHSGATPDGIGKCALGFDCIR